MGLCFSCGPKRQGSEQIVAVVDAKNERRLIRIMANLSSLSQTAVCEHNLNLSETFRASSS